jgi:hypothetical protein
MTRLRVTLFALLHLFVTAVAAAEYEYDGNCAESLAHGQKFATTCSIVWTSDSGKTYCFGSSGAKDKFVSSTGESVAKADAFWNDPEYWKAQVKLREAEQKQAQ